MPLKKLRVCRRHMKPHLICLSRLAMKREERIEDLPEKSPGNSNVQYQIVVRAMEWREP